MISHEKVVNIESEIAERIKKIDYCQFRDISFFQNKSVIHFGSGNVTKSNHKMIEKISKKVISIDSDIESGSNYKTITEAIDKETYKYDGLFCEHVVEHIPVQELPQIFKELRVLLKKDADVVITVPNIYNFGNFFQNYEHINYSPPIHIAAIIEMEGYKCDNIFSWSKQKHFIRHTNFNETEVYIANFMEREYGLQLGRYVTIKMKTL